MLPQEQLLESNKGIRILQPEATVKEVNHRHETPLLRHWCLRVMFDNKELPSQYRHELLVDHSAFSHHAQWTGNTHSDPATGSLCTAHRASSDTRLQRQFCIRAGLALHKWTSTRVKEKQPSSSAVCRQVEGRRWMFLLRATLLRLAAQTGSSMSSTSGGRMLCNNGNPLTRQRSNLAVSDDLLVLLSDCTRLYYSYILIRRLVLQFQLYLSLTLTFTSPQHTPKHISSDCNICWQK